MNFMLFIFTICGWCLGKVSYYCLEVCVFIYRDHTLENFDFELFWNLQNQVLKFILSSKIFLFAYIVLTCKTITISHLVTALVSSQASVLLVLISLNPPSHSCWEDLFTVPLWSCHIYSEYYKGTALYKE